MSVRLFPGTQVPVEKKRKAVWAFCRAHRYGWNPVTRAWDAAAYADEAAMLEFYNTRFPIEMKKLHRREKKKEHAESFENPDW